ncbi:AraC family transcriptional regulator [Paraflavitalea sp. CAU 1676]|uniref:AraC family transcriptional regulator n=1 Tax=Paraflavitalea sp. CAU 1676 TaxID=3032598 RepID=UPI0023DB8822|nr:AraC family transcriptional regulator [Paraflavitalea sp. CAU 1676]MDF2193724.1 AraC family transcriptional regulator [Paraflavitalea sp. CAU 1676]
MKPAFEAVKTSANHSFLVRKFTEKHFSAPYHYHPEYELTLIVKGSGRRYVGSHMQDYDAGDLVLLGGNLPHCWKTGEGASENSVSIVVHFRAAFLGEHFFVLPEMKDIQLLLNACNNGLHFKGDTSAVRNKMTTLLQEKNNYSRLILLLDLLYHLATASNYTVLQKRSEFDSLSLSELERIHQVIAYIVDHFQDDISLDSAAAIANMTVPSFCKYFKRITRKTFVEAVNDYRIDFATRELVLSDKSISQICFDSGFKDVSNFHRTFKAKIDSSPLQYRLSFRKKL